MRLGLALVALLGCASEPPLPAQSAQRYEQARQHLAAGRLDSAAYVLEALVQRDTLHYEAALALGKSTCGKSTTNKLCLRSHAHKSSRPSASNPDCSWPKL